MMATFWLYNFGEPRAAVRGPTTMSPQEVRQQAASRADLLCDRPTESPDEYRRRCLGAEVLVFDNDRRAWRLEAAGVWTLLR